MSHDADADAARLTAFLAGGTTLAHLPRAAGEAGHVHWSKSTAHELLTFSIGGQLHALAIREVREVAKLPPLLRVPRLAGGVLGLMSLRGDLLPVLDAARVFAAAPGVAEPGGAQLADAAARGAGEEQRGLTAARPRPGPNAAGKGAGRRAGHVIVLGTEEALLGLAVDRLLGVRRLPDEAVVPRLLGGGTGARECIAGFAKLGRDTVVVLDGDAVGRRFAEL